MINAMRDAGLDPGSITADDTLHRFDAPGDKPNSKNGWYVFYDGDIQAGRFGSWKTGESISWCSKKKTEFNPEEKAAYKSRMEAARRAQQAELEQVHADCRSWCKTAWDGASPASSNHPYLLKKQVLSHGLRQYHDSLMVPLQALSPSVIHGIQFISSDGSKKFKTGTAKQGNCHLIGKPIDSTMIVCEGYATGASIYQATGHAVLIAFDAGNLKPVAEALRKFKPDFKIIIAADNDRWADKNPGLSYAREAVQSVGGILRYPSFNNTSSKPTDFNDLHILYGMAEVNKQIFAPDDDIDEPPPIPDDDMSPLPDVPDMPDNNCPFADAPFSLLGYNRGDYYYLPHGTKQIKILRAPEHTKSHLMELARLQWWESSTFASKSGFDSDQAANAMIHINQKKRGVFDVDKIRGRGAWLDAERSVVHVGDRLIINGNESPIESIDSEFIYERSIPIKFNIGKTIIKNSEAIRVEELCETLSWHDKKLSGKLLAGWCVLSSICGALPWRPHLHITGGAGSGKSWIVDNIVRPIAGPGALIVQGATSEAGIRQALGADARPVIFDEAEGEDQRAHARMQQILELARQSSSETGGSIYKGSQSGRSQKFSIRSMFCFASIGVSQTQQADQSRISVLSLKTLHDNNNHYKSVIVPMWKSVITEPFCSALRARNIKQIPVIVENARVFSDAIAQVMNNKRFGDQNGALLAGTWSLRSTNIISASEALKFSESVDWKQQSIAEEQSDEQRCLNTMLEHLIRMPNGESISIADLIRNISGKFSIDEASPEQTTLKNYGFRVVQGGFCIANNHSELKKIMQATPWPANWSHILGRLPGAVTQDKPMWFSGGATRCKILPLNYIIES